jgi:hypothetical protein
MSSTFILVLVAVGAYLAAHVAFGWLAKRFLIVSGAEYLLLGVLLGPQVTGLISASVFSGFAPFLTLALGWIGTLVGAQFYLPSLLRYRAPVYRIAFFEAAATFVVMAGAMTLLFGWLFEMPLERALSPAVVLGAIATASSPAGIGLVAQRVGAGAIVRQLQMTTAIDALVAVTAFGLLLSIDHPAPAGTPRPPTATEWAVISVGIGVVGGTLFHLFLGEERKIDRLFISLAGAIILASGAAAYMRLSPLLPAMLIGAILINTSGNRQEIAQVLVSVERPIYFVLLIFAGAAWQPSDRAWILPVIIYLLVRIATKTGAAYLGAWANGALPALGPHWGRALWGQGGLAIAIALNYLQHEYSVLANVIFTAALVSVLLTDVMSARVAESVVRSARERLGIQIPGAYAATSSASPEEAE